MTHEIPVLRELILLAGASLAVLMLFRRLRLPATVGFIVTGTAAEVDRVFERLRPPLL